MLIITDPRPRCLDLCCKAGGASRGYQLAGFRVTGVDHEPQKHYIGDDFVCADMFEYAEKHGREYDLIHASPPCERYSRTCAEPDRRAIHPDLIAPARALLQAIGRPYIIENVEDAAYLLVNPVMLCGSRFGLPLIRHRYFECSHYYEIAQSCQHVKRPVLVTGVTRRRGEHRRENNITECREAMGIDWMTRAEIDKAIPPAYTEYLGRRMREMGL